MSALHKAVGVQHGTATAAITFHVANHCDINSPSNEGLRPIDYAVKACHDDAIKLLIDSGCDLNLADADGRTPLHRAVSMKRLCVKVKMAILEHER